MYMCFGTMWTFVHVGVKVYVHVHVLWDHVDLCACMCKGLYTCTCALGPCGPLCM